MNKKRHAQALLRERGLHYRLLGKVYAILRSSEWRVRLVRLHGNWKLCAELNVSPTKIVGTVDEDLQVITVDFREDVIATVIHECLHVIIGERYSPFRRKDEEREVQRLERLMLRHLSHVQATRVFCLIAERLA